MRRWELPDATSLTAPQHAGWACVWCHASLLTSGGVSAGVARGSVGAVVLDIEVYACPIGWGCGASRSRKGDEQ